MIARPLSTQQTVEMVSSVFADSLCRNRDCSGIEQFADAFSLLVLLGVLVSFCGIILSGCGFVIIRSFTGREERKRAKKLKESCG